MFVVICYAKETAMFSAQRELYKQLLSMSREFQSSLASNFAGNQRHGNMLLNCVGMKTVPLSERMSRYSNSKCYLKNQHHSEANKLKRQSLEHSKVYCRAKQE